MELPLPTTRLTVMLRAGMPAALARLLCMQAAASADVAAGTTPVIVMLM
jgi:hypothetical protein